MKRKKIICCECGQSLPRDEIALCKKLLGVDTEEFYCMDCLSDFLGCVRADLEIKVQEFKEQGCTLFL